LKNQKKLVLCNIIYYGEIGLNELIIHYHLQNDTHEMNAKILNVCEAKIISIFEQLVEVLGLQVDVELRLVAREEGGLRDKLKYIISNNVGGVLIGFISQVLAGLVVFYITKTSEEQQINMQQCLEVSSDLQKQIKDNAEIDLIERQKQTEILAKINQGIAQLNDNIQLQNDIKKKKSVLYKALASDEEIEAFSVEEVNLDTKEYIEKSRVNKDQFENFILEQEDLEPIIDRDATIAIISPVLNSNGKYKWRGEYKGEAIDFYMTDGDFKKMILSNQIKFGANDLLSGVLKISRKINEVGEEIITNYAVEEVFGFEHDDGSYTETQKGYKERLKKNAPNPPTELYMNFDSDN